MKAAFPPLAFAFWISSWFPTEPDELAVLCTFIGILGLVAVILVRRTLGERRWPAKALSILATSALVFGSVAVVAAWSIGTSAEVAIHLFFVVGFAGYLFMLSEVLTIRPNSMRFAGKGSLALVLLASWSWASALAVYAHRGAPEDADMSCILVPAPIGYDTELSSIWEMRLPQVVTSRTGPTGTVILDYHAILVAQTREGPEVYNWSKKRLRFEVLDKKRNPYLPTVCP